jgi:hypothetical protein
MTKINQNRHTDKSPIGSISPADLEEEILSHTQKASREMSANSNPFPDVYPERLKLFIREAKDSLGFNEELFSCYILLACSTAIGKTRRINLLGNTVQYGNIYFLAIAQPGSNKSAPLKEAMRPISTEQASTYDRFQVDLAEWQQEKGDDNQKPTWIRYTVDDITVEKLARVHQENRRGITVQKDELNGWLRSFNRYSNNGEQEKWLEWWSYHAMNVDRVGLDYSIYIPEPFLSVGGTIQPGLLHEIGKGDRMHNGFVDRFLFCYPDRIPKSLWSDKTMPQTPLNEYRDAIKKLLALDFDSENHPVDIVLTSEAKKRLIAYFNEENRPRVENAECDLLRGIFSKFDLHTARLALLLQMLWYGYGEEEKDYEIDRQMIDRAIELSEYFQQQSLKVYEKLNNETPVDQLDEKKKVIYEKLPGFFKKSDGKKIAEKFGMPTRTFEHWLKTGQGEYFTKPDHGYYEKVYT